MMDLTFKERTFDKAFAEARRLKLSSFMWKGRPYHTERADEQETFEVAVLRSDVLPVLGRLSYDILKNPFPIDHRKK